MPRARSIASAPQISLFPFLSILACLAGVVMVLISVLSLIQATRVSGSLAQNPLAREFVKLSQTVSAQQEIAQIEQRIAKLQALLKSPNASAQIKDELIRELQRLLANLEQLRRDKPELDLQIAALRRAIELRQKQPDESLRPVRMLPGGSGIAAGRRLFVIETSAGALTLHRSRTDKVRISSNTADVDKDYNTFLQAAARNTNSLVLFLVRDDGFPAYEQGAGWAQAQYKIRTGKLPIPGKGPVDLTYFEPYMR